MLPADRSPAAWLMRRAAPCFHHALLLQRAAPRRAADNHAEPALQSALAALADLQLDDEARDLGLRSEHIAAVRAALAAFLDECAANQPGGGRWRDALFARAGLPRSANVGHEFFEALEQRLALPAPGPADLAVLQIHATCLFLGLRGRYGAQVDAAESELQHQLRRLRLRLRPLLTPRPPPTSPPVRLDMSQRPPATALCVAALLLAFTLALIAGLHAQIHRHADELRDHLAARP